MKPLLTIHKTTYEWIDANSFLIHTSSEGGTAFFSQTEKKAKTFYTRNAKRILSTNIVKAKTLVFYGIMHHHNDHVYYSCLFSFTNEREMSVKDMQELYESKTQQIPKL